MGKYHESKRRGCTCSLCKECCTREPGWFLPNEVDDAAVFMGLPRADFIAKFCKEHMEDDVIVISPAQKPRSTSCIFLDSDGLCKIHEVKPYECKKVFGCGRESRHQNIREIIKRYWR